MHTRVLCGGVDPDPVIDATGDRHGKNVLAVVAARANKNESAFTDGFYADVRTIGEEYQQRTSRWA